MPERTATEPVNQAVFLVGGLGTRLGDLTRNTPKPLLEVGGRPFLSRLLDEVRRHGVGHILLLAGYKGERVLDLLGESPDVRILVEPEPLGTGGALRFAHESGALDERFFFLNGDSFFDINLWDLAAVDPGAEATLALCPMADMTRYGQVVVGPGGAITAFAERASAPRPGVINAGVGCFSRRLVDRIAAGQAVSIERDIYPLLAAEGALKGKLYTRPFIDIGVPDDFQTAQTSVPALQRRGAVVFDRDGVLNHDVKYAHRSDQIVWIEGAKEAVKAVNDRGLFAFVATNQAGVAHGYYGEEHVDALHAWMNEELKAAGAHIDAFVYCPTHPEGKVEAYRVASPRRKPEPGMLLELFDRFPVDRDRAVFIGDQPTDMAAARAAGIEGVLFEGGHLAAVTSRWLDAGVRAERTAEQPS